MGHPHPALPPSDWVRRFVGAVPPGRALDLACGTGRHTRLLLAAGHRVTAVDRDLSGIADLGDAVERVEVDLETGTTRLDPALGSFDLVVVTRYLFRPLLPWLVAAVGPGGRLIYETFARGNEHFGPPRSPDFLLLPDELWQAAGDTLTVIAFEQGRVEIGEGGGQGDGSGRARRREAVLQRICALRCPSPRAEDRLAALSLPRPAPPLR